MRRKMRASVPRRRNNIEDYTRGWLVDTNRGQRTAYLNGRTLKRWPYKLLND